MGINVLSLFDGISCGLVALKRAGIEVDNYYASEIDKYAIQIAKKNHPEIQHLGSVEDWESWDLPKIDLIIGGSPCQGFSSSGKRLNFDDPRSALFFKFVECVWKFKPRHFLLENVKMKKEHAEAISELLEVQPLEINSALVSAQNRKRLYWCNWEVDQPDDKGILLKDILIEGEDVWKEFKQPDGWNKWFEKNQDYQIKKGYCAINSEKAITMTARQYASWNGNFVQDQVSQLTGRDFKITVNKNGDIRPHQNDDRKSGISEIGTIRNSELSKGSTLISSQAQYTHKNWHIRRLAPTECERLQTLPDNYTKAGACIPDLKGTGKCAKQTTLAIIENDGKYYFGTNDCETPQKECPRKDMPTGVGYDLCKRICNQTNHAEVNACLKAGKNADGGILYLIGHTYCCDSCKKTMAECGIKNIVIGRYPEIKVSNSQRYKALGNGWTVDVIRHIFEQMPDLRR